MNGEKITPETEVSTAELACVLGVTARYIRQLTEDGVLEKVKQGRFRLVDSVQRYIQKQQPEKKPRNEEELERAKLEAEIKLKESKATVAALEAKELEGSMHRSEDVAAMTEDLITTLRDGLNALPGRLAVDVSAVNSPAAASEVIRKEVHRLMRELEAYRYDPAKYESRVRERRSWTERDLDDE